MPSELEQAAGALLAMAYSTTEAAARVKEEKPERAAQLKRATSLRQELAFALLYGDAWAMDPERVGKLLQEVADLIVTDGSLTVGEDIIAHYTRLAEAGRRQSE